MLGHIASFNPRQILWAIRCDDDLYIGDNANEISGPSAHPLGRFLQPVQHPHPWSLVARVAHGLGLEDLRILWFVVFSYSRKKPIITIMSLSVIHPWNLFLLIMAIPSLLGGLLFHFVPESPKFLMSRGLNKEALAVFQEIYRRNHNRDEFPIKALVNEKFVVSTHDGKCEVEAQKTPEDNIAHPVHRSLWTAFKAGLAQMATIFEGPYLKNCILVFTMQVGFLWSQNTMRLWLPSILGMISNYYDHAKGAAEETSFDLCNVIEWSTGAALKETNSTEPVVCSQVMRLFVILDDKSLIWRLLSSPAQVVDGSIYLNTITMGMVGLCGYAVAGIIMNAVSQRHIICEYYHFDKDTRPAAAD